jgi:hypothetical protein
MKRKINTKLAVLTIFIVVLGLLTGCSGTLDQSGSGVSTKVLPPITIPWSDYEKIDYIMKSGDKDNGSTQYTIEKVRTGEKDFYKIDKSIITSANNYVSGAVVTIPDLKPVSSYVKTSLDIGGKKELKDLKGEYKDVVTVTSNNNGKRDTLTVILPKQVIDNEYLAMAIRGFSLKLGFQAEINCFSLMTSKTIALALNVVGKEKVTVPYGTIECYKLELSQLNVADSEKVNLWYSLDDKKMLVKYGDKDNFTELKSIQYQK